MEKSKSDKLVSYSNLVKAFAVGITIARLPIADNIARDVKNGKSIRRKMGVFVLADVLDGVVSRRLDVETSTRRGLDSVVDRISIVRVACEVAKKNIDSRPKLAVMACAELIGATANLIHTRRSGEIVHSSGIHKIDYLGTALYGLMAAEDNPSQRITGSIICAVKWVCAADFIGNAMHPRGFVDENGIRHI